MLECALYVLPVGRQDFGLVNPEVQIIEGQIIEVLLYIEGYFPMKCTLLDLTLGNNLTLGNKVFSVRSG